MSYGWLDAVQPEGSKTSPWQFQGNPKDEWDPKVDCGYGELDAGRTDYAALEKPAQILQAGTLRVVIGDTRPLAQLSELHAIGEAGSPMGRLVATV